MPRHQPIIDGTKRCKKCLKIKPSLEFFTILKRDHLQLFPYCKLCCSRLNKEKRKRNKHINTLRDKVYRLRNQYRMTFSEFEEMRIKQKSRCLICQGILFRPHIDHNHSTGKIRGLLCGQCNVGIGFFKEDAAILRRAIKYIKSK